MNARRRAHLVLDRAREGRPVSQALVTMALKITGDLMRGELPHHSPGGGKTEAQQQPGVAPWSPTTWEALP
jgi:hypothetical protein